MPSIQVTGQLVDPTTGAEGSAEIKITSLINYGNTTKKSSVPVFTDASGNYDFPLVEGVHMFHVKYSGEYVFTNIGTAIVGDGLPAVIDLISLIESSSSNPEPELVSKLQQIAQEAEQSASEASGSAYLSEQSKLAAAESESAAAASELNAATSESNALASENAAKASETAAALSEVNATTSETNAANSASGAATSEANAAASEANALTSENAASLSETNAGIYEANALSHASDAQSSADSAQTSAAIASSMSNYSGVFQPGTTSAIAGNSYTYNESFWVCLVNTTVTPSDVSGDWYSLDNHDNLINRSSHDSHPATAISTGEVTVQDFIDTISDEQITSSTTTVAITNNLLKFHPVY